jgi:hypothetical protein
MKKIFKIIIGVVIAGVILAFGGCALTLFTAGKAVESVDKSIKQEQKKSDDKDKLLQAMLDKAPKPVETKDDYSYTVEYTLKNDTDQTFDYIQISADVFDSKGVKLGNDMTNITDVKPNQTFKLKLDLYQEGASSYKITSITSDALK